MNIDLDTWIISDSHFGHDNIVKFCQRPEHHNQIMRANWFEVVKPEDTVLHLGDLGFGSKAELYMADLPGDKHIILGNHDKKSKSYYNNLGFEIVERFDMFLNEIKGGSPVSVNDDMTIVEFLHDPLDYNRFYELGDIVVHGHIHNNGYHPHCPEDIDFRNVSVEVMDYRPTRLRDILFGGKYQSRKDAGINEYDAAQLKE